MGHVLAGIPSIQIPDYVEVVRRGDVIFAVNHRDEEVTVDLGRGGEAILGTLRGCVATLAPFGVCVVVRGKGARGGR